MAAIRLLRRRGLPFFCSNYIIAVMLEGGSGAPHQVRAKTWMPAEKWRLNAASADLANLIRGNFPLRLCSRLEVRRLNPSGGLEAFGLTLNQEMVRAGA